MSAYKRGEWLKRSQSTERTFVVVARALENELGARVMLVMHARAQG